MDWREQIEGRTVVASMRSFEAEMARPGAARSTDKGMPPPTFFQAKNGGGGECWPIDEVVRWSRTARGGTQYELFEPDHDAEGCVRWGLCDTGSGDE